MSTSTDFTFRMLSDQPTSVDEFDSRSHDRTAEAIGKLVANSDNGGAIALVGRFGSGKSSIVKMVKEFLRKSAPNRVEVFIFDAWAHQGEALRYIFLEQLGAQLLKGDKSTREKWEENLRLKTSTKQISRQKTSPTCLGILLGTVTLATTYGFLLLNKSTNPVPFLDVLRNFPFFSLGDTIAMVGYACIGLFIIGLIPAVLVTTLWTKSPIAGFLSKGLGDLLDLSSETSISAGQTIQSSSVVFRDLFSELMGNWNRITQSGKNLLIVIDNMDKVPRSVALAVWSTLQIFVEMKELDQYKDQLKNLWLLVTFDRDALIRGISRQNLNWSSRLVTTSGDREEEAKPDGEIREPKIDDIEATALIEKTFQITFQVPMLVSSAWEAYFERQFNRVFGEKYNSRSILEIYSLCRDKSGHKVSPTPRDINLFLNRLLAFHLQAYKEDKKENVSLVLQALYCFFAEDLSRTADLYGAIRERNLLTEDVLSLAKSNKDQCLRALAALHFGVKPDEAIVILVERQLEEALRGDTVLTDQSMEKLKNLMHDCSTAFDNIAANIVNREQSLYALDAGKRICTVAKNLALIEEMDREIRKSQQYSRAWGHLHNRANHVMSWPGCELQDVDDLCDLLKDHKYTTQELREKARKWIRDAERGDDKGTQQRGQTDKER